MAYDLSARNLPASLPIGPRMLDIFSMNGPYAPISRLGALLAGLPTKRSVFVSYHHQNDQAYYNQLSKAMESAYSVLEDRSLEDEFDSDDTDYVMQQIRDQHITGTSCTIVLCGSQTYDRKYIDWEIKSTLFKNHALIGIGLPTIAKSANGLIAYVPNRLYDNITSGYALWLDWYSIFPLLTHLTLGNMTVTPSSLLKQHVEAAILKNTALIDNARPMMSKNGFPKEKEPKK